MPPYNSRSPAQQRPFVATVQSAPAPPQIYFIHADHLNTPRVITNAAGQAVWRWDNLDPFGMNAPDENPSGLGSFTCNLRFPGQYFDRETNLHYNYFRDYDPSIGRYVQSDPIGLAGGINTYAYVGGNPLSYSDPSGLISPVAPERQRRRDCTQDEYRECAIICGDRGVESCKVNQTWRVIRYKDPPNVQVWGWVDG